MSALARSAEPTLASQVTPFHSGMTETPRRASNRRKIAVAEDPFPLPWVSSNREEGAPPGELV